MTEPQNDEQSDIQTADELLDENDNLHYVDGVGAETRVRCPNNDGEWFGPHETADHEPAFCPYCGAESGEGDHWVHDDGREVNCPSTGMSTYRYCPGCGEEAYPDE